jgi:hypothetical protein
MAAERLAARYADLMNQVQPLRASSDMDKLVAALTTREEGAEDRYRNALACIASARSDGSPDYKAPRYGAEEARQLAHKALYGHGGD